MSSEIKELFITYPFLSKIENKRLIIFEEDNKRYEESKKIKIDKKEYSIEFINDLLNDQRYYDYYIKMFNSVEDFITSFIYDDMPYSNPPISKMGLLEAILDANDSGLLTLEKEGQKRLYELLEKTKIDDFIYRYETKVFNYTLDEKKVEVPFELINKFFLMTEEETEKFYKEGIVPFDIGNMTQEEYAYIIRRFIADFRINNRYYLPGINNKYGKLLSSKFLDYEAINKFKKTNDFLEDIEINDELKKIIFDKMPEDLSELDKAIYVYIKLCKTLTYDEEFYVFDQSEEIAKEHMDIKHIKEITPNNNRVVCYEFNAIYAKLLSELGINLETKERKNKNFSGAHVNLSFRCGKYLIKADSVTAIFESDMTRAKLNQPLQGLECINKSSDTRKEFRDDIIKIQKLINKQNNIDVEIKRKETFEEVVSRYGEIVKPKNKMSIDEKLQLLIRELRNAKIEGIDNLSYAYELRKILFNARERNLNIAFNRMRINNILFDENKAMPVLIITTNDTNLREDLSNNKYYIYVPNRQLLSMSREELNLMLDNKKIEYIKERHEKIPGLNYEGEIDDREIKRNK